MLPEDERRLQREADIAKAMRGPDYSRLESEIAKAKSEAAEGKELGRVADAHQARHAAIKRALENSVWIDRTPDRDEDRER